MKKRLAQGFVLVASLIAFGVLLQKTAHAQGDYPNKPVRMVVAYPPGGPADIAMRIVAEQLSMRLSRNFLVENRPGAGGIIGTELVATAAPDGYTLLLSGNNITIAQLLSKSPRYDAVKSFAHVARFAVLPSGLFVAKNSPHTSLADVLAHARSHPDAMTYASGGNGTPSHLAMELLKHRSGVAIRHIPYKGTAPAVTDLIGGQVDLLFTSIAGPMEQVKAGRLRLIAASSPQRLASLPEVPAIAETFANYKFETWLGVSAPRGTPNDVVGRLSVEIGKVLEEPSVVRRMDAAGLTPSYVGASDMSSTVEEEARLYARVIKDANITVQ